MKNTRNVVAFALVAGVAYAAGSFGWPPLAGAHAENVVQPEAEPPAMPEMDMSLMMPGKWHGYLQPLAGEFEIDMKAWMAPGQPPIEMTGTVKRTWVLGGRHLKESVTGDSPFGPFEAIGYIGYNNADQRYENVWLESHNTAISSGTGTYDPDTRVFTFRGDYRDPMTGSMASSLGTVDISDEHKHVYAAWVTGADGKNRKQMEAVFTRKNAALLRD